MLNFSCTSFVARPYACEQRYSKNFAIPRLLLTSVEMITFYGDCSLSSKLMRESGDYYRINKQRIDYEVKNSIHVKNKNFDNLFKLAKIYNCNDSEKNYFAEVVLNNKNNIFSDTYDIDPKEVMINIQKMIEKDDVLKNSCIK